ncbi:MAG: hypothetical protein SFX18_19070 [Pirellulales bacterium]|nr:hypothetical protein [Pirellulales bacterium]
MPFGWRFIIVLFLVWGGVGLSHLIAQAPAADQDPVAAAGPRAISWEYLPYRVTVELLIDSPELPDVAAIDRGALAQTVREALAAEWQGAWDLQVQTVTQLTAAESSEQAPPTAQTFPSDAQPVAQPTDAGETAATESTEANTAQPAPADSPMPSAEPATEAATSQPAVGVPQVDKRYRVRITPGAAGMLILANEYDYSVRTAGPRLSRQVATLAEVPPALTALVRDLFSPVARVEQADGATATLRLRAARLHPTSKNWSVGRAFRPFERTRTSGGWSELPAAGTVRAIPGTWLSVQKSEGSLLTCQISLATGTTWSWSEQTPVAIVALGARPLAAQSVVRAVSSASPDEPLAKVLLIATTSSGALAAQGFTDNAGQMKITLNSDSPPSAGNPLWKIQFRAGDTVLAELPYMPGYFAEETVTLPVTSTWIAAQEQLRQIREQLLLTVMQKRVAGVMLKRLEANRESAIAKNWQLRLTSVKTAAQLEKLLPTPPKVADEESTSGGENSLQAALDKRLIEEIQQLRQAIRDSLGG